MVVFVEHLPVQACRTGDRIRRPIEHDVGDQLIFREDALNVSFAIAPVVELLNEPGRETSWRVSLGKGKGVGFGTLYLVVGALLVPESPELLLIGAGLGGERGRCRGVRSGDMNRNDVVGVVGGESGADAGTPTAPLSPVALVPKPHRHQLVERRGYPPRSPAALLRMAAESKARHCRDHQIKGVGRVAAVSSWVGKWPDHFVKRYDSSPASRGSASAGTGSVPSR